MLSIFSIHHVTRPPTTWRTTGTPRTCWAPPRSGTFSAPSTWRRSSRRGQLELAVRLTVSPAVSLTVSPTVSLTVSCQSNRPVYPLACCREKIAQWMETSLDDATDPWGVKVERVEM